MPTAAVTWSVCPFQVTGTAMDRATFDALISTGIGMTCDMTGGSSGGPWFLDFDETTGTGILNSVNSYKINFIPTWMFGPYFGADAQGVYEAAQAA